MPIISVNNISPTAHPEPELLVKSCRESPTGFLFIYRWRDLEVIFTKLNDLQVFKKDLPAHLWEVCEGEDEYESPIERCTWTPQGKLFIKEKNQLAKKIWGENPWMETIYWAGCYRRYNKAVEEGRM